jgi:hypothetical protein
VAYDVANVSMTLNVADGGGPRGAKPPRGVPKRSEAKRKDPPRGLDGKPLRPPPPPRPPIYRSTLGVRGAARPPGCKPAPGVVGGPVRGREGARWLGVDQAISPRPSPAFGGLGGPGSPGQGRGRGPARRACP